VRKQHLAHVPGARTAERVAAKRGPERTSASSPTESSAGPAVSESPEVSERPLHEHLSAAQVRAAPLPSEEAKIEKF